MVLRLKVQWLLWSALAALSVVAITALSFPLWVCPLVERQVSDSFARPVTIGHLSLHLGRSMTVVADDVQIGNPDGFAPEEQPFARLPRLTATMDLVASLRRRALVIASVEIERPTLRVIATEDGRANYHLFAGSRAPVGGLRATTMTLLDIWIRNGRAHVSLASLRADFEVSFATDQQAKRDNATRVVAQARGMYAGQPLDAQFAGGLPLDWSNASRAWPVEMSVQNGPTRASVNGTLQDQFSALSASVGFLIAGPDAALLRPLTGVVFPVTPPYELRGKLDFAGGVYRVTDAAGRLGRSELEGAMTVATRAGRRPEITAQAHSRSADLRDITSVLGSNPGPAGTPGQTPQQRAEAARAQAEALASPRVLSQAPLHVPNFERADVHLNFYAQRIQSASMPFDDLAVGIDVVDGSVAVHRLTFGIGAGRLSGDIRLTPQTEETVRARAGIKFERVDVARLMRASGGYQGSGALSGTMDVEGSGRSIAEILAGADGTGTIWMAGGDLSALLVDLAGLRLGSALLSSLGGSPTRQVECFLADLALRHGVVTSRALLLETADAITEGTGAVDLRQERVEVRLRTESKRLTLGVLPAPLLISGTLKKPRVGPDPDAPAGRGGLAGAFAALPTLQLGLGDDPRCKRLLSRVRGG